MDRQIKSGQFPQSLQPMLKRHKKIDLFGIWLDHNQNWDEVVCHVEREMETKNLSRKEWVAIQAKTLKGEMEQTKYDDLIRRRTEQGLYYDDDDFPDDPLDKGSEKLVSPKFGLVSELVNDNIRVLVKAVCTHTHIYIYIYIYINMYIYIYVIL